MNRVLRKRLGRELKTNFARYLALVLLIVMGMYIIVSVVASADTIIDGTAEHGKQNKVEDGQFGVFIPLTDEQEKEITDKGITLEQHFSIDVTAKDGSKLRVFRKRNDIDLIELDSGRFAEKKGEAVVEKRYSEEHSLSVGDKLTAGGVEFEIVGIGTTPDYDTPFENFSDTAVSSKGFGLLFVSDDQYDYFKNDSEQKAEDFCYAYRLNGKATDDELKEMIEDFDFDYKKVTDKYYLETIKDVLKQRDDISNGIDKLYDGSQTLKDGVKDLSEGADALMTQWADFTRVQRHSQRVRTLSRQELRPHMTAQKTCQRVQDLHTAVQRALQMVLTASKSRLTSFLTRCSPLILTT